MWVVLFLALLVAMVVLAPLEPTSNVSELIATAHLQITEVMSSNQSALPDEMGNFSDWMELTNAGDAPVSLRDWGLSTRADKILFTFPAQTLAPGERVVVYASKTSQSEVGKAYHANFKISAAGATLILFGPDGRAVEHVQVPSLAADTVYAKTGDSWIITDMYTPGFENTQEGYAAFRTHLYIEPSVLMLNELVASNHTTLQDEDGEYSDWIELYNNSDRAIDLHNYALSDKPDRRVKWRFPQGAIIGPGETYVVFASGKNRPGGNGLRPHTNFRLSAERGILLLSDIQGRMVDQASYELLSPDQSWGRRATGDRGWQVFTQPTPGLPNNTDGALEMNRRLLSANPMKIAITEVLSSNVQTVLPNGRTGADYVELYNYGDVTVSLEGCGLSDRVGHPRKWRFPAGISIAPHSYLLVYCDGLGTTARASLQDGVAHTSFKISSGGETLVLSDPNGRIADKLVVPPLFPDMTYGRTPSRDGLFYFAVPTPGRENGEAFAGFAQAPGFAIPGGKYDRPMTVAITVPEGAEVRYTLDASDPTPYSARYEGPIEIASTTVLRARSFQSGLNPSQIATQTYFISIYPSLPVLSLVTDPDNVWNEATGMLALGPNVDRENDKPRWTAATYAQKLHYDGHLEMYMQDGEQALSTGMAFHVMGQFSLDMPQKSFSVNAKTRFGTGYFEYPLFPDRPYERYKSFALRNGGQDGMYTRVLDGMFARIARDTPGSTVISQAWRPVVVYLNGVYWGQYNLRERVSRHFIAQYEGWDDPDAMDILEANGTSSSQINWGSNRDWKALQDYLKAHDLNDPDALQYVLDRVDVDNLFDYYNFEMYFGNTDPGNIRFYKKHGEGNKWRWVLYDVDWGFFRAINGGPNTMLNEKGMGAYNINNLLIRKLLNNPDMRDKFLRRLGELFQTVFTPEAIMPLFDSMIAQIEPELGMHFNRWAEEMPKQISFDVPKNPAGAYNYWVTRVDRTKNVINSRPYLFWKQIQDFFKLSDAQMETYFGPRPAPGPITE